MFEESRLKHVRKVVEAAKEKSKKLDAGSASIFIDSWDYFVIECPICENDAVLIGYTDESSVKISKEEYQQVLDFYADSFECDFCGLVLKDEDELEQASICFYHDRSDELDAWNAEKHGDEY